MGDVIGIIFFALLFIFIAIRFAQAIRIVPAQEVYIVERLGKYHKSLHAGFHPLVPFIDKVAYKLSLKEEAIDVPSQLCITRDNVQVEVDGVVYMKVIEPFKATYNIDDYRYALIQLAQTTMRSVFGGMDLDKTFEEREALNARIVNVVGEAGQFWGIDILRYEIQNISPPRTVLDAMEKQMAAVREKRAEIATSEGEMTSQINRSEGLKQELINHSEGEKQKMINEAEGQAQEIISIGKATAEGIRKIAGALQEKGGERAMQLSLSQQYLKQVEGLAQKDTSVILPVNLADLENVLDGLKEFDGRGNGN